MLVEVRGECVDWLARLFKRMLKDASGSPVNSALACTSGEIDSRVGHQDSRVRKLTCRDIERRDSRTKTVKGDRAPRRAAAEFQHIAAAIGTGLLLCTLRWRPSNPEQDEIQRYGLAADHLCRLLL